MRTIELELYQFNELDEKAKERARDWWRSCSELAWCEESRESITAFIEHFGGKLLDWNIGPYMPLDYRIETPTMRGVKLRDIDRDNMPTGYCLDCSLWMTFYDEFKRTGDARHAFNEAVEKGFYDWRADMEWQLSDEYIDETIIANEYEFTIGGKRA